jgi:ribosomal protein S27AE
MRRLFDTALGRDLRLCPTCRRSFVVPREILASHDDGNHVVELACSNCGWSAIQLHGGVRLSAFDQALDRDSAQIQAAAEALAMSVELERIDQFADALYAGYILPEDF